MKESFHSDTSDDNNQLLLESDIIYDIESNIKYKI